MDFIRTLLDFVLHLDKHLGELVRQYGAWTYGILALIIFCETGLVVTPFLPGDSLLFAAGALAGAGAMNVFKLWPCLLLAVIAGDNVNYFVGLRLGRSVFKPDAKILKTEYLHRTEKFYEKYGGRAIMLARFLPIIRTYAPFVAGASRMKYTRFLTFSAAGALVWITLFLFLGYFFGGIPAVQQNFGFVIIAIILISAVPAVVEVIRHRRSGKKA